MSLRCINMNISKAEQQYWDALERLKNGKTKYVDTKSVRFKFTKDAVGREAGKSKGYVRYDRYPILCDAISDAENARKENGIVRPNHSAKLQHEKNMKIKAREKYDQLKLDYDLLMTQYLNVVRRNFELETGLIESQNIKLVPIPNNHKTPIIKLI